ncbi:MAG: hypothetical protein R2849_16365 [Thermomicrobiales bacterium]
MTWKDQRLRRQPIRLKRPDERLASTPQALSTTLLRSAVGTTTLLNRWGTPASDQRYVAETLEWIAKELGLQRALMRLLPSGVWIVQTVVQRQIRRPACRPGRDRDGLRPSD